MQEPFEFLNAAMARADHLYLWTHYFDKGVISAHPTVARHFVRKLDRSFDAGERSYRMHARSYLVPEYKGNITGYWEGGLEQITYWIEQDALLDHLRRGGFEDIRIHADTVGDGMPILSLCASRTAEPRVLDPTV